MFREILFFLGYRLCYKTPWHTSNWSRIQWKRWNKNIYIFIFLEFSWQEPWGKLDTKHYSPLPHENEFETLSKSFFFFFFLVRETNRAMYNLQVETETRTNQYQFPVYFGPKLQPKKKKKPPSCQFCLGGGISWNGNFVLNVVKLSKPSPRRKEYCQQGQFQPIDLYPFCKSSILGLRETFDLAWHF